MVGRSPYLQPVQLKEQTSSIGKIFMVEVKKLKATSLIGQRSDMHL